MAVERIFNFAAGPAVLPIEALEEAQRDMLALPGVGMSILEISHRSKAFEAIIGEAEANIRKLGNIPENYHVLFLQGGATTQFSMVPMNFLPPGAAADYVVTGSWSSKAQAEAKKVGTINTAFSGKAENFIRVPKQSELKLTPGAAYVSLTSNETIHGVEFHALPDVGNVPLVVDTSSHMYSRPIDVSKCSLIYAGAQKNMGPAGCTLVIVRDDFLQKAVGKETLPIMLQYGIHVENKSLYNTPAVFAIYMVGLVMKWLAEAGRTGGHRADQHPQVPEALRRHRRIRRLLSRPRRFRQPVADERHLPDAQRGTRGEVRQGVEGGQTGRPEGAPVGRRSARLHLQRLPGGRRGCAHRLHEGVPAEERVAPAVGRTLQATS